MTTSGVGHPSASISLQHASISPPTYYCCSQGLQVAHLTQTWSNSTSMSPHSATIRLRSGDSAGHGSRTAQVPSNFGMALVSWHTIHLYSHGACAMKEPDGFHNSHDTGCCIQLRFPGNEHKFRFDAPTKSTPNHLACLPWLEIPSMQPRPCSSPGV